MLIELKILAITWDFTYFLLFKRNFKLIDFYWIFNVHVLASLSTRKIKKTH